MFRSAWKNYHGSYQKVMMMMIMIMILIMMMTVMMMMTMMMMMLMPWVWILPRPAHEVWLSLVGRSSCRWRRLILSFSFFLYHSHIFSYSFYIILICSHSQQTIHSYQSKDLQLQQLCCWKMVESRGERGSSRHWWAATTPSLIISNNHFREMLMLMTVS